MRTFFLTAENNIRASECLCVSIKKSTMDLQVNIFICAFIDVNIEYLECIDYLYSLHIYYIRYACDLLSQVCRGTNWSGTMC